MRGSYAAVSGSIFGLVAIAQAVRALNQWPAQIGPIQIPIVASWALCAIAAVLCVWAFRSRP